MASIAPPPVRADGGRGMQADGILGLLAPWLTLRELCAVRATSRFSRAQLPAQTWELTIAGVRSAGALVQVARQFPNVRRLRICQVLLPVEALTLALSALLAAHWKLRELELRQVWCLHDGHVRILTHEWPALERLVILQCDQIKSPAVCGPNLRSLVLHSQSATQLHEDSSLPVLTELSITSRAMSATDVRDLIKQALRRAPALQTLDLSGCSSVEQVLIDPGDLPHLRTLRLRGCLALERLHVSSQLLQELDVRLCDHLSHVAIDLPAIARLNLAFLKTLTHLYVRSSSLTALTLRGDTFLEHETTQIFCPNLDIVDLEGTELMASKLISVDKA
jgi:hypothetical protein